MNSDDVINKLIEIRDRRKWTNYKIAKESNVPTTTISNIFNKKSKPQIDTLLYICNGFGITPAQFFEEDEEQPRLTNEQVQVLELWNQLSEDQKNAVKTIMELLYSDN